MSKLGFINSKFKLPFSKFTYICMLVLSAMFIPTIKKWSASSFKAVFYLQFNAMYLLILTAVGLSYLCLVNTYNYWHKLGVPCPQPSPIVGHTLRRFGITMHILEFYEDAYYNHNGRDFCGFFEFFKPALIVGNLELIRNIIIKDFDHFSNRRVLKMAKINPIANEMLSNASGEEWRRIRTTISPVFSSAKLKQLYPLIVKQGDEFVRMLAGLGKDKKELEMRECCGQFTMDTIASCAFGIECEAMKDDRAEFATNAAKIFVLSPARAIKLITLLTAPFLGHWFQLLGFDFTSEEFHFFHRVVQKTLRLREEGRIRRGDFLDLMKDTNKLTLTTMTAQAVLFLLAGYNNIASALSFTLHLLAVNPQIQENLRNELLRSMNTNDGHIDCDTLQKLRLLKAVVKESLRLYPADPTIDRLCTKDYQIPGTSILIKKGQNIVIPIWCLHRDPSHWTEPNQFKPERFYDIPDKDFGPYLPFGMGPRQCIGMKFVNLVLKVGLLKVLTNYKVLPSSNTVHPPPLSPKCFLSIMPKNGLPLVIEPLQKHLPVI